MKTNFLQKFLFGVIVLMIVVLTLNTVSRVNQLGLIGDGNDNFNLSYHLAKDGVISLGELDAQHQLVASNEREPFPVVLSALWIKAIPYLASAENKEALLKGKRIVVLKLQNIICVLLILVGVSVLAYQLYKPHVSKSLNLVLTGITIFLVYACMHTVFVNNLITEFHAEFLIVWFVLCWLRAWQTHKNIYYLLAGVFLGLLILTKAAFLYISLVGITFFIAWLYLTKTHRKMIFQQVIILVVSAMMVLPWFIRNHVQLGVWELAQRGPIVLFVRAYKNAMTETEFKGAFYAYAPASLKKTMKKITGFSAKDRLKGGSLQRLTRYPAGDLEMREQLNEHGAISYYMKATTHYRVIHKQHLQNTGDALQARLLTDKDIKKEAIQKITSNIPAHLRASLVFAWRGAWPCNTVDGRVKPSLKQQPAWQQILPFIGLISMFGLFMHALFKQKNTHLILSLLGVSTFVFYALATHFLPRYSEMFIAIWVVCAMYPVVILLGHFTKTE